jgi:hypothetical protein
VCLSFLITVVQQLIFLAFSSCAEDVVLPSEENNTTPKEEERIDPMEGRSLESRLSGMALFNNLRLFTNLETRKLIHEVGLFEFLAIALHPFIQ